MVISAGISQIGGKYRLRKKLLKLIPKHDFFLSLFSGACWIELNKPRSRYECFNDMDSELINYLLVIQENPKEFDEMKKGVFGLVSQEICNRIIKGNLQPRNNFERAYYFYYLNKLTFGGSPKKGLWGISNPRAGLPTLHEKDFEKIKASYRGITLPTVCKEKSVKEAKASYKGINPKTTRPFSNNDCGLLTPLDPKAIERLRYVNLTSYDFRKVYNLFYKAFHERKELTKECFIYADEPYPGTEKYYGNLFSPEDHQELINIMLDTPFNFMLSTGKECKIYLDTFKEAGWIIKPLDTRHSINANSQDLTIEYAIMNYDIKKQPRMVIENQSNLMEFIEV